MTIPVFGEALKRRAASMTSEALQVEVQGRLGLSCEEAFRCVTDASKLADWLPVGDSSYSDDSKAEAPGGVGSVRVIKTGPLPPTRERVVAYDAPGLFYAYSASDSSLMGMFTNHLGAIGFEPHPEGGCVMTWLAYGKAGRSWLMRYAGLRMFRFVLWNGTKNLEKRFPVARR